MRRILAVAVVAVSVPLFVGAGPASWPDRIDLPNGIAPEGIEIGRGTNFYVGSLANGAIYQGDLRTGGVDTLYPGGDGTPAVGLAVDSAERVWAAGGATGRARVIDSMTGDLLATFQLTTAPTFINDVEIAGDSAWFTDSVNPVLYRVALDLSGFEVVPLTGDLVYQSGFNGNGIEATPDGKSLFLVQSNTGKLFSSDLSGVTTQIDLGGATVPQGDGILLAGQTLYVLQNRANLVAVVDLAAGEVERRFTNAGFDVPTTLARSGDTIYAVNARFGTAVTPDTEYWVTAFDR